MATIRQQRVASLLFEELSIMIENELEDPNLRLVRVTDVDVSRDLKHVKIFVDHQEYTVSKSDVLRGLNRAKSFIRGQIAQRCQLRAVPELLFYYDERQVQAARIDELLKQIADERQP
ncbi:MAG: 30S ribosome-binding factor RbfA [Chloroflexota bacterium]